MVDWITGCTIAEAELIINQEGGLMRLGRHFPGKFFYVKQSETDWERGSKNLAKLRRLFMDTP